MKKTIFKSNELLTLLRSGSSVVFPTDTLPALASLPIFAEELWKIKRRPKNKPLILMGSSAEELLANVLPIAREDGLTMAEQYWPGPLTLIMPSDSLYLTNLNFVDRTIGIRVPKCALALDLLERSGPLATTSANISGEESLIHFKEVENTFKGMPILGPLPWPELSGLASTVIRWEGKGAWKVVREGSLVLKNFQKS